MREFSEHTRRLESCSEKAKDPTTDRRQFYEKERRSKQISVPDWMERNTSKKTASRKTLAEVRDPCKEVNTIENITRTAVIRDVKKLLQNSGVEITEEEIEESYSIFRGELMIGTENLDSREIHVKSCVDELKQSRLEDSLSLTQDMNRERVNTVPRIVLAQNEQIILDSMIKELNDTMISTSRPSRFSNYVCDNTPIVEADLAKKLQITEVLYSKYYPVIIRQVGTIWDAIQRHPAASSKKKEPNWNKVLSLYNQKVLQFISIQHNLFLGEEISKNARNMNAETFRNYLCAQFNRKGSDPSIARIMGIPPDKLTSFLHPSSMKYGAGADVKLVIMDTRFGSSKTLSCNTRGVVCIIPLENKANEYLSTAATELRRELLEEALNAIVKWDEGYPSTESASSRMRLPSGMDIAQLPMITICHFDTEEMVYSGDRLPSQGMIRHLSEYLAGLAAIGVDVNKIKIPSGFATFLGSIMDPNGDHVQHFHSVKPDHCWNAHSLKIEHLDGTPEWIHKRSFGEARYYHSPDGSSRGARYNRSTSCWEIAIEYKIFLQNEAEIPIIGVFYVPIITSRTDTQYFKVSALTKAFTILSCMANIYTDYLNSSRNPTQAQIQSWKSSIQSWNLPEMWKKEIRPLIESCIRVWAEPLNLYFLLSQ